MDLKSESGYTLVESLVAMTIFVSVLIPMASSVGNSLMLTDTSRQREALHLAQSELNRALQLSSIGVMETSKEGYSVISECEQRGRLFEITVRVLKGGSSKPLAILHKSILVK